MLNAIRTASSKWLGRLVLTVIMGVLIVSFAIWGIGDIFRGGVNRTVASVGSEKISADDFRNAFNLELRRLQQRVRRPVTTEQARAFGLDKNLLNQMIDESALRQKAESLGLAVDQATILRSITEASEFKTAGIFDRNKLGDYLQQAGLSEQAFVKKQGELLLRIQLYQGLAGGMAGSTTFGQAIHQFRDEERNVDVVVIPADKVATPATPDPAALKAFFEERKAQFRTVETRKATMIRVSPEDFARDLVVTEADLKAYYEKQIAAGRFGSPEKRQAQRVLFDTEADAKAAAEKLAGGTTFEALLAEKKLQEKDVDLGLKSAGEIADAGVRAAVFGTEAGKVSAPVKDPFGYVLIHVTKVEPAVKTPFESIRPQIEQEARADKLQHDPTISKKMADTFRAVEDQRIAGKSLAEAAKTANLTVIPVTALDRQGQDGNGKKVEVPGGADAVNAIFASDIGLDNEPLQQKDGGYVWFEVNGVDPARDKTFEEVQADVGASYLADQKDKALAELVTGLVKKVEGGTPAVLVASELGLPLQRVAGVKRSSRDTTLGTTGVERAFSGPVGKPVSAPGPDGASRLLILPVETSLLPYDPAIDEKSGLLKQVAASMSEDVLMQYTAAVRKELGVSINQSVLSQALGQTN